MCIKLKKWLFHGVKSLFIDTCVDSMAKIKKPRNSNENKLPNWKIEIEETHILTLNLYFVSKFTKKSNKFA